MKKDMSYAGVMGRKNQILKDSVGIDFTQFERGTVAFDYATLMKSVEYSMEDLIRIQRGTNVGQTPILEMKNLTALARKFAPEGKGARIFVKDEACNPAGSFKDRRAAISVHQAKQMGYKGVITATSGNYGAAVASQAAKHGLQCIVIQEAYDSNHVGQPEILEKARKCEAFGADVIQLSVGPELFYVTLRLLEETGYFNASLYTPYAIAGVETLGYEISQQMKELVGRDPDAVVVTNAGGGNLTGTARGLLHAGAKDTTVIAASVDLKGLHMASDKDFNRKSFTTGHTGFGVPFVSWPDRTDVPRSACRPLRYMDRYVTVTQGEVFYMTEALATLEGIERGPAGNTSLAAAFSIAQSMDEDQVIVVQETEYTGAGKHIQPQLSFARKNGIEIKFGDPAASVPGESIIFPKDPSFIKAQDLDLDHMKRSLIKKAAGSAETALTDIDYSYLAEETRLSPAEVQGILDQLQ